MAPQELAAELVARLREHGLRAELGPAVQYGHKVAVAQANGALLGNIVVYVGKRGPRRADNELNAEGHSSLPVIDKAWIEILSETALDVDTVARPQSASPGVIEPAKVARYAAHLASLANRAAKYGDGCGLGWGELADALSVLAERAGYSIRSEHGDGGTSPEWDVWANMALAVAAQYTWSEPAGGTTSGRERADEH